MFEYLLSNWDTLLYVIVFVVIYIILLFLWRKIASIETSVYRLDKVIASLCAKNLKAEEDLKQSNKAFNDVFVSACAFQVPRSDDIRPEKIVEIPEVVPELPEEDVLKVLEEEPKFEDDNDSKASITKTKLQRMTADSLREQARNLNISTDGTKAELISRILESNTK